MRVANFAIIVGLVLMAQPLSAQMLPCPDSVSSSHCDILEYIFTPNPSFVTGDVVFTATTTGSGTVQVDAQGAMSYIPARADVGRSQTIMIIATDSSGAVDVCQTVVTITNDDPTLQLPPNNTVARGQTGTAVVGVFDRDACDAAEYTLVSVTPQPLGSVTVDSSTGLVTFTADDNDAPGHDVDYQITVAVFDGQTADTGSFTYTVVYRAPFEVRITQKDYQLQGHSAILAIIYDQGTEAISGFDFEFAFASNTFKVQNVTAGSALQAVGWTNFSYDTTFLDSCSYLCTNSLLNIHADNMSSTGFATAAPASSTFSPGDTLALVTILVTNDRNLACTFLPLRWNWSDCNSNTLLSAVSDTVYQSSSVFDYVGSSRDAKEDYRTDITGNSDSLTRPGGMSPACDSATQMARQTSLRFVDFYNGGVLLIGGCDVDASGDINLNGLSYEYADREMFIDYFTQGDTAFGSHVEGSTAASETNADGRPLTVSDMVYMIRAIRGDAISIPELTHERDTVTLTQHGDEIKSDMQLGALHLVFDGETTVSFEGDDEGDEHDDSRFGGGKSGFLTSLLDDDEGEEEESHHSRMTIETGVIDGNTHVLIYDIGDNQLRAGEILEDVHADLLYADASDFNGSYVVVRFDFATDVDINDGVIQPTSFELQQNYPNPFNPTTTIAFSLPKRGDVELSIYNMLGQNIRTLLSQSMSTGEHSIIWDGNDKNGNSVASGMYLYRLKVGQ